MLLHNCKWPRERPLYGVWSISLICSEQIFPTHCYHLGVHLVFESESMCLCACLRADLLFTSSIQAYRCLHIWINRPEECLSSGKHTYRVINVSVIAYVQSKRSEWNLKIARVKDYFFDSVIKICIIIWILLPKS